MNFPTKKPKIIIKFFSVFLCLTVVLYSIGIPATNFYSYADEVCDPEDEDYQECIAEQERERLEEEEENRREAEEERLEQEREEKEAIIEEHEDDPNWIAPWLITPTPNPTQGPTPTNAQNSQTGQGSENQANSNSASQINVSNINSTTLDQQLNIVANTGNNTISGEDKVGGGTSAFQEPSTETGQTTNTQTQEGSSLGEGFSQSEAGENLSSEIATEESAGFLTDASGEGLSEGEDAEQVAISKDSDETSIQNENQLVLENELEVTSTSGRNELNQNEGNVSLEAGTASSSANLENQGNINSTEVGGSETAEAVNEETGEGSSNFTSDKVSETLIVENQNQAAVENNLSVSATSGENQLLDNEGDATLTTKEVEIIVNLLNILNLNLTGQNFTHLIINIFGNLTGEFDLDDIAENYLGIDEDELMAIAKNVGTGDNSENTAIAQNSETLRINNQNQAAVINNVEVEGVTGSNELSKNEGDVSLMTGRIKILTSILNFINANFSGTDWYFAMINIFGSLKGDILLPAAEKFLASQNEAEAVNSETGEDSLNQALASETEEISITNNNAAQVQNTVNVTADSGTNQSIANEDETEMETGEVNVAAAITNWLNYNIFGNRWVMIIVNIFGRWLGRVIAFPGKGDIEPPENGTLVAVAGGKDDLGPRVLAENSGTGENSENFASASSETNWQVRNENKAYLENNVKVQGVSGQNQTNENEGKVNVLTGWIDIGVNLFNIVNFNVTGRKWLLLIVNVFGDFLGNIVFPHQKEEAGIIGGETSPLGEIPRSGGASPSEETDSLGQSQESSSQVGNLTQFEEVVLEKKQPLVNKNELIRKYSGTFTLASGEVSDDDLANDQALDILKNSDYNQGLIENRSAYNYNLIFIFRQALEKLISLLKNLIAKII